MRIALIGQAAFGKDVLNALVENNEDVVAALCPPDRDGRPADPVKEAAETHGISVYQYSRKRHSKAIKEFLSLNIDLCVMAFVTDIVPMEMLEARHTDQSSITPRSYRNIGGLAPSTGQ